MRTPKRIVLPLLPLLLLAGCPEEGARPGSGELTIVLDGDGAKLREKEEQLARQRAELLSERDRIISERQDLLDQLQVGDDVESLVRLQRQLLDRERRLQEREVRLQQEQESVVEHKSRVPLPEGVAGSVAPPDPGVARREGSLAAREAALAVREKAMTEREGRLAEREARLAEREAGRAETPVAAPPSEPGRSVTRQAVEKLHKKVRDAMRRRGILPKDLPGEVAALERRIYTYSKAGRWLEAYDQARDLGSAVEALAIDDAFIQAKMQRLNTLRGKRTLTPEQAGKVEALLTETTRAFSDGRYAEANARLNRIDALLTN